MQEESQISGRKIWRQNGRKMFKMTKPKVYDKRVLSPKAVEKSCGKPGKFAGKGAMGKVVREFSKCVFHKLWRKRWHKMALFCGYRGETAHFRGYMVVRCWFFHKAGGKCRGVIRKGNTFPQARWISTDRVGCWIQANDRHTERTLDLRFRQKLWCTKNSWWQNRKST